MINQERVREMTKLAVYEKQEGKKHSIAMRYFRSDFTARHLLKAFVCATVVYGLFFIMWCVYHIETLLQDLDTMDLIGFGIAVLIRYLFFVAVYLFIVDIYANMFYAKCQRSTKRYYRRLRRLERLYNEEENRTGRMLLFESGQDQEEDER